MGRFTGKCDFMDTVEIFGLDKPENSGMEVYIDGRKLSVDEYPMYYTHLVSSMGSEKIGDGVYKGRVNLSSRDYNLERNEEMIYIRFSEMCKVVRSLKRKKVEFTIEDVKSKCFCLVEDKIDDVLAAKAIECGGNERKVDVRRMIEENDLYILSVRYEMGEYEKYLQSIGLA